MSNNSKPPTRMRKFNEACEDEHRLGLKPIIRRIYVPEGETPIEECQLEI